MVTTNYPAKRYTGPKPWMDYDWLYDQYVIKDRRTLDIANEFGCKQNTIQCWLLKHGIKKEITTRHHEPKHQYERADYLRHNHIDLHKSMSEIARENGVSSSTIQANLKKNGIDYWRETPHTKFTDADIDLMVKLYIDCDMSANKLSEIFHTDHNTIIRQLRRRGIETRGIVAAQYAANGKKMHPDLLDKELLQSMHWDCGMSCKEIGSLYGVDAGTVRRQMHRIGLKTKTNAESKIGLMIGDKHPNWKGGLSSLNELLREYFHTNQAPVIAKRDSYTCQLCGATHTVLHVHHVRPFVEIVTEICDEHPNLNVDNPDDRQELYQIITSDSRFLDENNLITFCKDCHYYLIHDYTRKTISSQASYEEGSETIPKGSTS